MDSSFYYYSLLDLAWYLIPTFIFIYIVNSSWLKKVIGDKQAYRLNMIKTPLVIVLVCFVVYLFLKDDELNPEVVELLEEYSSEISKNNNGSVYHLGMWSSLESSPYEVGLWRIEQYNNSLTNTELPFTSTDYDDYPTEDWIEDIFTESEKPKWLCDFDENGCLESIYNQSEHAIYLGDVFQNYIKRYDGVLDYTNFGLFQKPLIPEPMIMLGPGIDVLKIKLILNLHDFKLGRREAVIEELTKLLNHHKSVLGQTPYDISKVMSVVELKLIFKASAFLISKTNDEDLSAWKPYVDSLNQLEKDQLTFDKSLNHEFISIYNTFEQAGSGRLRKNISNILKYFPKSLLFKHNRTVNIMFKGLTLKKGRYELIGDRIIAHKKPNVDDVIKFDLSNPIGSFLVLVLTPKYADFDVNLYNLEVLQRLTKHLYNKRFKYDEGEFISPYTGEVGQFKGNLYCIDAQDKDDKPLCLSTI